MKKGFFQRVVAKTQIHDWQMATALIVLYALGLVVSISMAQSGGEGRAVRQLVFMVAGIVCALGIVRLETHRLRVVALPWYGASVLLLILVLIFGTTVRGTRGWFSFSFFSLQPVELMKLGLIAMLAAYFERSRFSASPWSRFFISGAFCIVPVMLVLRQPDVGSSLVLVCIWFAMAASQLNKRKLLFLTAVGAAAMVALWFFFLHDYQKERLMVVLQPSLDPYGVGYNTRQSVIAIGSGMLSGRGVGAGSQGHLRFLPEATTDFPFAVIAEELGFAGGILTIAALALVVGRTMRAAYHARDDFSAFIAFGIGVWFFFQSFVNVGMNLGLMPVIGIPLPFVSYGGSSVLAASIAAGVVMGVRTVRRQSVGG